jgi:tetratricopeptide (TPR) repeat protein
MTHALVAAAVGIAALLAATPAPAQTAPRGSQAASGAYIEGIQALGAGNYPAAVQSLTRAIQADDSNADYLRARGVAYTLAENFPAAIADLDRAVRLRQEDREARLWLGAAYRMGGDPAKGAQYFTMSGVPADYANMVYNDMAMEYWQSRYQGGYYDKTQRRQVQTSQPVKRLFPDAASAYARRHEATGAAPSAAVAGRVESGLAQGDFAAAIRDLRLLRRTRPDDPDLRAKWAQALVGAGDGLHAREEFTRLLSVRPLWADGYLGRAQAAAILGDARRANADLQIAQSMGANPAPVKDRVARSLGTPVPDGAVERFAALAHADAPTPQLTDAALAAQRWANNRRSRYDEMYQDRIRVLSEAIRDEGRNADWPDTLARFLHAHRNVPVLWKSPRATEQARPQNKGEQQQEIAKALALTETALSLDPKLANAMATRGQILYTLGRSRDAEQIADQGLKIEPQNVRLLRLKTRILRDTAEQLRSRASALRTPRVERSTERRSDGVYEVTRTYPPTAEALAEAARLDAQAAVLDQEAKKHQTAFERVEKEVIPGLLKRAEDALASGNVNAAETAFRQVYALETDRFDVYRGLAEIAKRRGQARLQTIYGYLSEGLRHSTAAEELKTAWDAVTRTDWAGAETALAQAAARDPVDARIPAYRSVVAAHRARDAASARRERRASIALDEAEARLMATSYTQPPQGPVDMISLHESGLQTAVRVAWGDADLAAKAYPQALEAYAGVLAMEKRFDKDALVMPIPTAMLPDPAADRGAAPEAPTLATLVSMARLGNAQALLALSRTDEAQREYAIVRQFLANWPATSPKPNLMLLAESRARLGQAEAAYAAKNYNEAWRILTYDGWPALPDDMKARIKQLQSEVQAARQRSLR